MTTDRDLDSAPPRAATSPHWGIAHPRVRRAAVGAASRTVLAAVLLIGGYALMPLGVLSDTELVLRVAFAGVLVVLVVGWELYAVDRAPYPQLRAVEALVVTVAVIVIAFATAYLNMSQHHTEAFSELLGKTGALYFTLTTLTTVGFGDIAPMTDAARVVVMVQMVANVVVIGSAVKLIMRLARHRMTTPRAPDQQTASGPATR